MEGLFVWTIKIMIQINIKYNKWIIIYKYVFLKLVLKIIKPTFYYSEIIIIYVNNCIYLPISRSVKFLFSLSASASAFAPAALMLLLSIIIMTK